MSNKNKKTGSSPTSKRNRQTARALKHKNTTAAREAGVPLPTADEIANQEVEGTRAKVPPKFHPKKTNDK